MAVYTTDAPGQDGHSAGGGWSDSGAVLEASQAVFGGAIGLVFDAAGLPIESGELRLVLDATTDTPALANVALQWVPQAAPANYSVAALPGARSELLVAEVLYGGEPAGTTVTLVLGQTWNAANQPQIDAAMAQLRATTQLASWSSRLAFTVEAQTGDTLRFVAAEGAGTAPTLDVVETAPAEVPSLAHVAKLIRRILIARLNADPTLSALSLDFEDMVGRAIEGLGRNARRGFVGTHPEQAAPDDPDVRSLEVVIVVVVGAKGAQEAADQLDDAQEAIENAIDADSTIAGLAPGGLIFASAEPALDGEGRRDYGSRALRYRAGYARRGR